MIEGSRLLSAPQSSAGHVRAPEEPHRKNNEPPKARVARLHHCGGTVNRHEPSEPLTASDMPQSSLQILELSKQARVRRSPNMSGALLDALGRQEIGEQLLAGLG